ncbi:MAG: hypothetical protein IJW86_08935 [Clostridia bacterium]|nr:hypothetical protein [Clostridia bacterium]
MKKSIILLLTVILCLTLCACGTTQNFSVADLEKSLEGKNGVLNVETSGKTIKEFTYVVEDINAEKLSDKSFCENAFYEVLNGNTMNLTYNELKSMGAFIPLMSIVNLLKNSDDAEFDYRQYTEELLGIVCDGNTQKYNEWSVSADIDVVNDSITILATYE